MKVLETAPLQFQMMTFMIVGVEKLVGGGTNISACMPTTAKQIHQ